MADNIRDLMEGWSRYRRNRSNGGYGKTILQRVLEGMPGTGCPTCAGKGRAAGALIGRKGTFIPCPTCGGTGRVKLDATDHHVIPMRCPNCYVQRSGEKKGRSMGEVNGRTCIHCRGTGQIVRETDKVNPAFITSTYCEPDHPTYQRIDRLVCELKQRDHLLSFYFVVDAEYCDRRGGTQAMKAERLGMSVARYVAMLDRALDMIQYGLSTENPVHEVEFLHA